VETVSHRRRASPPAKGAGHIVIISSRAGLATSLSSIHNYLAAKHGRIGLIKQLAQELGPFGMSVNSVAPGLMATSPRLRAAVEQLAERPVAIISPAPGRCGAWARQQDSPMP
jgi:NAD(P)-dependent dehydrogenase (short-subunit alcohol dehydrogenase family)